MKSVRSFLTSLTLTTSLISAPAVAAVESVLGLSINGVPAESAFGSDRETIGAVLGAIASENPGIEPYIGSFDALQKLLLLLRSNDPKDFASVPEVFRGLDGLALIQAFWSNTLDKDQRVLGRVRLKGKLIDYTYDKTEGVAWVVVAMKLDWFTPVSENGKNFMRVVERDFLRYYIEFRPDVLQRDGSPGLDSQPFTAAPGLPRHATDPADQRSVWKRGLTHKLMANESNVVVKAVFHKENNDGPLRLLGASHPLYGEGKPGCIDFMFAGEPPETHLPDQIGWCFGMCDKQGNRFVVNSNGD